MAQATTTTSPATLRRSALGLLAVAGIGAVIMSPSLGLYFVWGGITTNAGIVAPLIFLIALLISIPTAISYAMVSKELPSAGQAYTWLWRSMRPEVGLWIGIVLLFYYMSGLWANAITNSVFFAEVLRYFGAPDSNWLNLAGIAILFTTTALIVYNDIRISARVALGFLAFETLSAAGLGLTVIIEKGVKGKLSAAPLTPHLATGGYTGISAAVIFGILAFIGYDYSAVVAEEAKTPRRLIPLAVVLSTVILGVYWMIFSYGYSLAVPVSKVTQFAANGFEPATPIAKIYWHAGSILVAITGVTATIGIYIATVPVLARVVYAMARDGALPNRFQKLNKHQNPGNAATLVLSVALVGALVMAALQRGFIPAFSWFGNVSVFFALVTYIFVNAASFNFYRRFRPQKFSIWWNVVVPFGAIAIDAYVLYQSFFHALWHLGFAGGSSVIIFALIVCAVAVGYVIWLRFSSPALFQKQSFVLPELETE
jgi:putrescine importer